MFFICIVIILIILHDLFLLQFIANTKKRPDNASGRHGVQMLSVVYVASDEFRQFFLGTACGNYKLDAEFVAEFVDSVVKIFQFADVAVKQSCKTVDKNKFYIVVGGKHSFDKCKNFLLRLKSVVTGVYQTDVAIEVVHAMVGAIEVNDHALCIGCQRVSQLHDFFCFAAAFAAIDDLNHCSVLQKLNCGHAPLDWLYCTAFRPRFQDCF